MDMERWQMTSQTLSLSYQARREVLASFLPCYRTASSVQKSLLLDTFVKMTGYAQIGASVAQSSASVHGSHPASSSPSVWSRGSAGAVSGLEAARSICTKRLIPFLPTLVGFLERQGYLRLSEESRTHLLSMSVTTAERLLRTQRKPTPHGLSTTKAGTFLNRRHLSLHPDPYRYRHRLDRMSPSALPLNRFNIYLTYTHSVWYSITTGKKIITLLSHRISFGPSLLLSSRARPLNIPSSIG
jgi:hypothetical protein